MNTFKDLSIAVLPFAFWFTLFCKAMGRWVDRKWYSGDIGGIGGIGTFVMTLGTYMLLAVLPTLNDWMWGGLWVGYGLFVAFV